MDNNEKIKIGIDVEGNADDVLGSLQKRMKDFERSLKRLSGIGAALMGNRGGAKSDRAEPSTPGRVNFDGKALKQLRERMSLTGRLAGQSIAEEQRVARARRFAVVESIRAARVEAREQRQAGATALRDLRQRLAFQGKIARQRAAEDADAARHAARQLREKISGHRYVFSLRLRHERELARERDVLRDRAVDFGRSAGRRTRDMGYQVRRSAERTAIGAAVVGGGALRKVVRSEADVDAAEVDTRIYGGLSGEAARKLRNDWASALAEQLGSTTSRMLSGYTEALKVGIPNEGAKAFSGLAVKTSEAWGLDISDVTDTLGTINQIITSAGDAFSFDKIKSVANTVQHLSAKQATTPGKLVEYLKRGAGGAQVLGMSQEAGLAFGSASTSLGNRAGTSGELIDYIASRVIELPKLVKRQGTEGQDARQLVAALGYGSADAMDRKRRRDPDAFLPDLIERFSKIRDPKKRDQSIRSFAGREWMGEFGRIVTGQETYKDAFKLQRDAKDFDAIEEAWSLHTKKLSFIGKQLKAGFLNFLGEFGQVLTPFAVQIKDYFLSWSDKLRGGGIGERFKAAIGGFIEGLGFKDLPNLLEGIFGKPGQGDAGSIQAWRETFRGVGAGIRDIADAVKRFFVAIAGADAGPEELGRWAGRFVALGGALLVLSPVIGLMTSLASGLLAVAAAVVSAWSTMRLAGLIGGATAGARTGAMAGGAAAGGAALPLIGGALTTAAIAKWFTDYLPDFRKRGAEGVRDDQSKGIMGALWGWLTGKDNRQESTSKSLSELPPEIQILNQEINRLRQQLDGDAQVQKQSYQEPNLRSMMQNASLSGVNESITRLGGLIQYASLGGGMGSGLASAMASGGGGGSSISSGSGGGLLANSTPGGRLGNVGIGRQGIMGGRGGGGGGSAVGIPDSVPMTAAERNTLGLIMKYESGGQNKMNYMGTSQGLSPTTAKGYTAQGYFQMLNSNWQRIAPKLGINTPNAMASSLEDQTKVALHLLRNGGIQNWSNYNPKLRAALARGEQAPTGTIPAIGGSGAPGASGGSSDGGSDGNIGTRIASLRRAGAITNAQCVSLAKAYVGDYSSVKTWQRGDDASNGTLKAGTPIATFLNRDGSQSRRYAGGGTGTPGANLDHAGVFQSYVKDAQGNNVGLRMFDQWAGRNGQPALRTYMFGQGQGEKDGRNYAAIRDASGQYLGGSKNPMSMASSIATTGTKALTASKAAVDPDRMKDYAGTTLSSQGKLTPLGVANSKMGLHEGRDQKELSSWIGHDVKGDINAWCARFVNASLRDAGMKGTGSAMAESFAKWGQAVKPENVKPSDVLYRPKEYGGGKYGHAAIATGKTKMENGLLRLEAVAGNHDDAVGTQWLNADEVKVRRGQRMTPEEMTRNVPLNPVNSGQLGRQSNVGGSGGSGGDGGGGVRGGRGGGSGSGGAQIVIQGHNGDPETLANAVQRKLNEQMSSRTTDLEHNWG